MLALAAGPDAAAVAELDRVTFAGGRPGPADRWTTILAVRRGLDRPATREAARRLAGRLASVAGPPRSPLGFHLLAAADPAGDPLPGTDSANDPTLPAARWVKAGGWLRPVPGSLYASMTAAAPLAGDFALRFELEVGPGLAPLGVLYADLSVKLAADGTGVTVNRQKAALVPPLALTAGVVAGELRAAGGRVTVPLGGRVLADRPAGDGDPWVRFAAAGRDGGARVLGVTGGTVPPTLGLPRGRGGMRFDPQFYTSDLALADQLVLRNTAGRPFPTMASAPLPDDGHFDYQFFYEPGRAAAWPVVGDAPVEPADRRVPKPRAWNAVRAAARGGQVVVAFNGVEGPLRAAPAGRGVGVRLDDRAALAVVRGDALTATWPAALFP